MNACPRWCNLPHGAAQPHAALFAAEVSGTGVYMSVRVEQEPDRAAPTFVVSRDTVNVQSDAPAPSSGALPPYLTLGEADALGIALDVAVSATGLHLVDESKG